MRIAVLVLSWIASSEGMVSPRSKPGFQQDKWKLFSYKFHLIGCKCHLIDKFGNLLSAISLDGTDVLTIITNMAWSETAKFITVKHSCRYYISKINLLDDDFTRSMTAIYASEVANTRKLLKYQENMKYFDI